MKKTSSSESPPEKKARISSSTPCSDTALSCKVVIDSEIEEEQEEFHFRVGSTPYVGSKRFINNGDLDSDLLRLYVCDLIDDSARFENKIGNSIPSKYIFNFMFRLEINAVDNSLSSFWAILLPSIAPGVENRHNEGCTGEGNISFKALKSMLYRYLIMHLDEHFVIDHVAQVIISSIDVQTAGYKYTSNHIDSILTVSLPSDLQKPVMNLFAPINETEYHVSNLRPKYMPSHYVCISYHRHGHSTMNTHLSTKIICTPNIELPKFTEPSATEDKALRTFVNDNGFVYFRNRYALHSTPSNIEGAHRERGNQFLQKILSKDDDSSESKRLIQRFQFSPIQALDRVTSAETFDLCLNHLSAQPSNFRGNERWSQNEIETTLLKGFRMSIYAPPPVPPTAPLPSTAAFLPSLPSTAALPPLSPIDAALPLPPTPLPPPVPPTAPLPSTAAFLPSLPSTSALLPLSPIDAALPLSPTPPLPLNNIMNIGGIPLDERQISEINAVIRLAISDRDSLRTNNIDIECFEEFMQGPEFARNKKGGRRSRHRGRQRRRSSRRRHRRRRHTKRIK